MKKRILALLLALVLVGGVFAGCSGGTATPATSEAPAGDALFTAGEYTGKAAGYGGELAIKVTFSDSEILSIEPLEHSETAGVSDGAFEKIPAQIIANQTLAVDTVAGCTSSSTAIIEAVTDAATQAGADPTKLQKAIAAVAGEAVNETADIVIVGAGGAGMSAAVEAVKAGSSVIVVEKMPAPGGNTIRAGSAMNTSDPELQKEQEMSESELAKIKEVLAMEPNDEHMAKWQATLAEEIKAYEDAGSTYLFDSPSLHKLQTYIGGDFVADPALIDVYAEHSLAALEFLTELGAEWEPAVMAGVGATWKRSHKPSQKWGGAGSSFILPQVEYAEANGVKIYTEFTAEHFIKDGDRVVGVKGTKADGSEFTLLANKGVILATGGFGANIEMRQSYDKHWGNLDESIATTNHPGATGDGIVMAEEIGVNLVGMEWIQVLPTYGPGVFTAFIENQFYINKEGERFIREDTRRDELSKAVLAQTDGQTYIISDSNTVNGPVLDIVESRKDSEYIFVGETIEELAGKLNIPAETLQASVDQFNEARTTGNDPLGRQIFDKEFGVGPFYAGLTGPMVHHTMGGVQINPETRVLDKEGNIIPGLFAAGEVTGGIHGSNRLGGNAISDVTAFGRIAGQTVAAEEIYDLSNVA